MDYLFWHREIVDYDSVDMFVFIIDKYKFGVYINKLRRPISSADRPFLFLSSQNFFVERVFSFEEIFKGE